MASRLLQAQDVLFILHLKYNCKNTEGNSLPIRAKAKNAQGREGLGRASREKGKLRGRSRGRGEG
jgi:hypothetical protein